MRFLVPFLIIVPALEIALFILSGQLVGLWWTLFLILFTGVAGALIAKNQGLKTLERLKLELRSGQIPQGPIMDSFCILVGGVLILTPGFITDSLGLSLLLPVTRVFWKRKAKQWFRKWIEDNRIIIMR
ncbi:MAG TPA: FxsA family protein [Bacillus sp. (in: firmicutes)]|uniref:FxsA family protein n=1 Tax=Bacillus litorisediminis TaxID=2922713 RepID=UPI001FACF92B|nr:FxsA family protein [Bacillus litorisediminis]HWO75500.1 FxsA family protein [Bacillus sp. (in: firmicutes)]